MPKKVNDFVFQVIEIFFLNPVVYIFSDPGGIGVILIIVFISWTLVSIPAYYIKSFNPSLTTQFVMTYFLIGPITCFIDWLKVPSLRKVEKKKQYFRPSS